MGQQIEQRLLSILSARPSRTTRACGSGTPANVLHADRVAGVSSHWRFGGRDERHLASDERIQRADLLGESGTWGQRTSA
jgi:hypothetical protein